MACSRTWCGVCCSGALRLYPLSACGCGVAACPLYPTAVACSGTFLEGPDVCYRTRTGSVSRDSLPRSPPFLVSRTALTLRRSRSHSTRSLFSPCNHNNHLGAQGLGAHVLPQYSGPCKWYELARRGTKKRASVIFHIKDSGLALAPPAPPSLGEFKKAVVAGWGSCSLCVLISAWAS